MICCCEQDNGILLFSKTKESALAQLKVCELLKNVCFMQLVLSHPISNLFNSPYLRRHNPTSSHNVVVVLEKRKERSSLGRNRRRWNDNIETVF